MAVGFFCGDGGAGHELLVIEIQGSPDMSVLVVRMLMLVRCWW